MLNDARELVSIVRSTSTATVTAVRGFHSDDKPWGLACLNDGSVWTMASSRTIARLSPEGTVAERVNLGAVWVSLFASGDHLLFQSALLTPGGPALATSRPRQPGDSRPWPGIKSRPAAQGVNAIAYNLVRCGLASGETIPCWFGAETDVWVSDGVRAERHAYPWIRGADIDPSSPLRDIALIGDRVAWVLTTAARFFEGRSVGHRLFRSTPGGAEGARTELTIPARLIVDATPLTCLVLLADGQLMEVSTR
jgi:hypothetical protein